MVRRTMQTSPEFHKKMMDLQKEIMGTQKVFKGVGTIQKEIIETPEWLEIEKKILKKSKKDVFDLNFDGRRK